MNWDGKNHPQPGRRTNKTVSSDRCPGCNVEAILAHCIQHDVRSYITFPAGPDEDEFAVLGIDLGVVKIFVDSVGTADRAIRVEALGEPVMVMTEDAIDGGAEDFWWDVLAATRMMLDQEFGPVEAPEHVH